LQLDESVAESKPVDALQRAAYEEEMVGWGMQNIIGQEICTHVAMSSIKRVYDKVFAKIREGWDEEKSDAK